MEARVEAGDLRDARHPLGHGVDRVEVVWLMEGRERNQGAEIRHDLRRDDGRLCVFRTAVHDAVTDAEHSGTTAVPRAKPDSDGIECPARVDAGFQTCVGQPRPGAIAGRQSRGRPDAVDLAA
jgi:hypothetical protein